MRRFLACAASACLLCSVLTATVRADVLIELDDNFWEENYKDCDYVYRQYTVNSPDGYAVVWKSPESSRQKEILVNGTEISGSWRYTDSQGDVWLALEGGYGSRNGKMEVQGWIRISDCLVVPDYISFQETYGQEFVEYDPAYDHAFDGVEKAVLWTYPCSGVVRADQIDMQWFEASSLGDYFSVCWRDPQGRMWAFLGYWYGIRNAWICLDDPTGAGIEKGQDILARDAVFYPAADAGQEDSADDKKDVIYPPAEKPPVVKNGVTGLTIAGVLGVTAVTAGLIWFFFGRKKGNKGSEGRL